MGAFCTIFRARPVGTGLGTKFGRKPTKNQIQIINFIAYSKQREATALWHSRKAEGCREGVGSGGSTRNSCTVRHVAEMCLHPGTSSYPMSGNSASGPDIGLPGRPDSSRESINIGPPAGLRAGRRADFEAFSIRIRLKSGQQTPFPARKQYGTTGREEGKCRTPRQSQAVS